MPRYDRGPVSDTRDQLPRRGKYRTRGDAAAISKRRESYCRAVSSLHVPRPSQLFHVVVDFGLFCGAGSLRKLFKKCPTSNLLPQLASVALPAVYTVSLNIQCMGADGRVDFVVGECLGCNRVSSTSLSTSPADLHFAWGPARSHRIVCEANASRLL